MGACFLRTKGLMEPLASFITICQKMIHTHTHTHVYIYIYYYILLVYEAVDEAFSY